MAVEDDDDVHQKGRDDGGTGKNGKDKTPDADALNIGNGSSASDNTSDQGVEIAPGMSLDQHIEAPAISQEDGPDSANLHASPEPDASNDAHPTKPRNENSLNESGQLPIQPHATTSVPEIQVTEASPVHSSSPSSLQPAEGTETRHKPRSLLKRIFQRFRGRGGRNLFRRFTNRTNLKRTSKGNTSRVWFAKKPTEN